MTAPAAVTAPVTVTTPIGEADRIYRAVMDAPRPSSKEAMAAIGYAAGYCAECLSVHARLLNGDLDWQEYDADLWFRGGDPQAEAAAVAADRALEAALAAAARLAEYRRREAAQIKAARGEAA